MKAVDADGLAVAVVGTLGFAVAAILLGLRVDELRSAGHEWWLWVALTGVAMGLLGLVVMGLRRRRRTPR